jgi:hypothetical protein
MAIFYQINQYAESLQYLAMNALNISLVQSIIDIKTNLGEMISLPIKRGLSKSLRNACGLKIELPKNEGIPIRLEKAYGCNKPGIVSGFPASRL